MLLFIGVTILTLVMAYFCNNTSQVQLYMGTGKRPLSGGRTRHSSSLWKTYGNYEIILEKEFIMNEKVAALLNEQINKEFYSAYLYIDIANYYTALDLDGYANYYMVQAQEERDHALLFMKYMQNNGLKVTLEAIGKPDKAFDSILTPLEIAAEHERYVTSLINNIYHEAHQAKDYRTMKFLDWFVDEQMEEEENADKMISRYQLFGSDSKGLYLLDQEYASRVYTAPTLVL